MKETIQYIIQWLLYGNEEAAQMVGYTNDPAEWDKYKLVIIPSGHMGKDIVYPDMSNPQIEGHLINLDIVYNTFFFLSRAEEVINPQRDQHGRFIAQYSILGKENRLQIPLLDEYARFLTKQLERACEAAQVECPVHLPKSEFSKIYLTHDIDTFDQYRHIRGVAGGIVRGEWKQVKNSWQDIHSDPAYTFPWLMECDRQITHQNENCEVIYFLKHTKGKGYDYPQYNRHSASFVRFKSALLRTGAKIGIHSSYYGLYGKTDHALHRSHYLKCDIANMERLIKAGVTDDFTMMFPDECGFRMQTTRSARWINPITWQVTQLTLHPLVIMDCTLSNKGYMNLNEDEAYFYCSRLIEKVRQNGGELCILWHNNSPAGNPYQYTLYPKLLQLL